MKGSTKEACTDTTDGVFKWVRLTSNVLKSPTSLLVPFDSRLSLVGD